MLCANTVKVILRHVTPPPATDNALQGVAASDLALVVPFVDETTLREFINGINFRLNQQLCDSSTGEPVTDFFVKVTSFKHRNARQQQREEEEEDADDEDDEECADVDDGNAFQTTSPSKKKPPPQPQHASSRVHEDASRSSAAVILVDDEKEEDAVADDEQYGDVQMNVGDDDIDGSLLFDGTEDFPIGSSGGGDGGDGVDDDAYFEYDDDDDEREDEQDTALSNLLVDSFNAGASSERDFGADAEIVPATQWGEDSALKSSTTPTSRQRRHLGSPSLSPAAAAGSNASSVPRDHGRNVNASSSSTRVDSMTSHVLDQPLRFYITNAQRGILEFGFAFFSPPSKKNSSSNKSSQAHTQADGGSHARALFADHMPKLVPVGDGSNEIPTICTWQEYDDPFLKLYRTNEEIAALSRDTLPGQYRLRLLPSDDFASVAGRISKIARRRVVRIVIDDGDYTISPVEHANAMYPIATGKLVRFFVEFEDLPREAEEKNKAKAKENFASLYVAAGDARERLQQREDN